KDSIAKVFEGVDSNSSGRVIAFAGMTGGTGSSVIAQNVAHELTVAYDEQAIIVDLDLSYGTAALTYNMQPRQTIVDALSQTDRLDASLLNQFFMDFGESKLSVLASPASLSIGRNVTPESLDSLMRILKPMAEFIVLDVPHVWEPWVNDVIASANDLILICRPDLTNLRNAKNVVEFLGPKRGVDYPTRVVLNQVGAAKRADLADKDFKDALALDPSLSIPYDPEAFGRALNNGEMMSKASAKSKATAAIIDLAKLVSAREKSEEEGKKKGFSMFKKGDKK
ncbi:MAG: pilus assembly protein CpaE, partial [Nitrospinota bacterium]|nr:pilus assembly protein CpaE [Nitrospinota bacterium]